MTGLPEGEEDRGRAGIDTVPGKLRHSPREDLLEARTVAGRAKEGGMRGDPVEMSTGQE